MIRYFSKSGKESGVTAYEIGEDYITVMFGNKSYTYSEQRNGKDTVDYMKVLAANSEGLSTFISRNREKLRFD